MYGHHHHGGWGYWGGPFFRGGFPVFGGPRFLLGGGLLSDLLAGGLGYMLGRWSSNQGQQSAQYQQPYQPYQTPPVQSSAQDPRLAQLELLGRLRASGVLTEQEFEAEKERILRGF
jgi:hypothetical protein